MGLDELLEVGRALDAGAVVCVEIDYALGFEVYDFGRGNVVSFWLIIVVIFLICCVIMLTLLNGIITQMQMLIVLVQYHSIFSYTFYALSSLSIYSYFRITKPSNMILVSGWPDDEIDDFVNVNHTLL